MSRLTAPRRCIAVLARGGFELTAAALRDDAAWDSLADSVAVEVRRNGASAPVNPQSAPTAPIAAARSRSRRRARGCAASRDESGTGSTRGAAACAWAGRPGGREREQNSVHVDNRNSVNRYNTNNSNFGNSSNTIVLL